LIQRMVLTGPPARTSPASGPRKDPNPPLELLGVAGLLVCSRLVAIDVIRLFGFLPITGNRRATVERDWLVLDSARGRGLDNVQLDLDQLPNLALHINFIRHRPAVEQIAALSPLSNRALSPQ
jgi:hypothetical protein